MNAVVKIKQFLEVINLCLKKKNNEQMLEINVVVRIIQFLMVIKHSLFKRLINKYKC